MKKIISLIFSGLFIGMLCGQNEYLYTYHSDPIIDYQFQGPFLKCSNGDKIAIFSLEENKIPNYPYLLCVLRIDNVGDIVWSLVLQNQLYSGYKIIEDNEGNFYFFSFKFPNACAVKLSKKGEVLWIKSYGNKTSSFVDADIISSGDIVALGEIMNINGVNATCILKLNKNGEVIWQKSTNFAQNGSGENIITTDDGGCIFTGERNQDIDYNGGRFVAKINNEGDLVWIKSFGFANSNTIKILKTGPNNYTIIGQGSQIILTNIDETGKINWSKQIPNSNGGNYEIWDALLKGNNVIFVGRFVKVGPYNMFLLNFSLEGKINWLSIFSPSYSLIAHIEPNSNEGFDLNGFFEEASSTFEEYPFFMKTDSLGQIPCLSEIDYNPPLQVLDYPVKIDSVSTLITLNNVAVLDTPIIRTDITIAKKVICESNATQNIQTTAFSLFSIYPNPASSEISIELTPAYQAYGTKQQIEISDALGRKVYSGALDRSGPAIIPTGSVSPGYYVVSMVSNGKVLQSQKLVVTE